eukprot:CAMPEP_0174927990 /NCGR_PEP_ID=MMETSP1355-20121228/22683_1 /TAXON_ID=464990 /ORGANISM="Hemiselmis tepida, Strain CCMP443" /LENGTH=229 /DNA_ID=CAMNT_0016174131 /DNA_START=103 /DNA_END=792 /DNA_ORIENTATION=+
MTYMPLEAAGIGSGPAEPAQQDGLLSRASAAAMGIKNTFSRFPLRMAKTRQVLAAAGVATAGRTDYSEQPQAPAPEQGQPKPMRAAGTTVLKVFPIKGDGRCMFRSIARTIAHAERRPMSEKLETEDADYMRQAAWQVICVDKRAAFEQAKVIEGDMRQYCASMKSPTFYGGEPELFVLSELLRRPIAIYVPQQGGFKAVVEYGTKYLNERDRIRLLYNGNNHYDALLD